MSIEIDGLGDLTSTIENLGKVGQKAGKTAIKKGLDIALEQQKKDAPRDTGKSRDNLMIQYIRTNNNGSAWGACGIGAKNWESTKSLWFQNYGYENHGLNFSGQKITTHVGWMDKVMKQVESKSRKVILDTLKSEIDKVLK